MLEELMSMLNPPAHANVGEAYHLHQTLNAFYYLRAKCLIFESHCQDKELKRWFEKARGSSLEYHIKQIHELMDKLGLPQPASLPEWAELTDQFMAIDGAAMVKGMIEAHLRGLTAARRPDVALFFNKALEAALIAGADLLPIIEREGWIGAPPAYPAGKVE